MAFLPFMKRTILFALSLLLTLTTTKSKSLPYRVVSTIKPSQSDELRCLLFDKGGLLWIGSSSGLKSWDGYEMATYRSTAFSPGILPNNTVISITEDHNDCLWLGTRNGLVRMNQRTGEFRTFFLSDDRQRIIYSLFTSSDGTVWIGTDGGLTRFLPETGTFENFTSENCTFLDPTGKKLSRYGYSVKSMVEDREGNLYIGTWNTGLLHFDIKRRMIRQYRPLNALNSAYSLLLDSKDRLWIGTWGYGLLMMPQPDRWPEAEVVTVAGQGKDFSTFYKIVEDPVTKKLWGTTIEGISIIDPEKKTLEKYTDAAGYSIGLCNDIAVDETGRIWATTISGRLFQFSTQPSPFRTSALHLEDRLASLGAVCSLYSADGQWFWMGVSPYGLVLYNRADGTSLFNKDIPLFDNVLDKGLSTRITSIIRRRDGTLWMASNSYGIISKKAGQQAEMIDAQSYSWMGDNYVNSLFEDSKGNVWVGQRSCLSRVRPDNSGDIMKMADGHGDFSNCDVRGFTQDSKGNIWVATDNMGIVRISDNNGRYGFSRYYPGNGKYAVDDAVSCYADSHGRLWAISVSGGLFRYDSVKDLFIAVNKIYNIDGDRVFSINEDVYGNLWLAADGSLVRLTIDKQGSVIPSHFTDEDILGAATFYPNATYRLGKEIYFGSDGGMISFEPTKAMVSEKRNKARLLVTDILLDGKRYMELDSAQRHSLTEQTPRYTRSIVVPHGVSKLSVEFVLLNYSGNSRTKYAYMLEGHDNDWRSADSRLRRATVENIPSGSYTLHLKATDNFGYTVELPYAIFIKVLPPWYQTWWAFVIYFLIVACGIWLSVKWYKEHIKTKNRLQMAVVFTNITHELLTPLTVISAAIDQLRQKAPGNERQYMLMQNNISRLTRLLRQILEVRKSQAGQLRLKVSCRNLAEFIEAACDNIRPMAEARGQQMVFTCGEGTRANVWFDPDKMDKIMYNLLSNAVKYNRDDGRIEVGMTFADNVATITVADQGIGISREKMRHLYSRFLDGDYRRMNTMGTGIGLSLTRDLVVLHHGSIDCESKVDEGTTFTINIPIGRDKYQEEEIDSQAEVLIHADAIDEPAGTPIYPSDIPCGDYSILIVEDNEDLLGLMSQLIGQYYKVYTAKNGEQALNIIHRESLDLVVSDVMMPKMDGIELTRRIKQSDDYAQLPVLLLTAKTRDEDRDKAYETGADEYMTKPFKLHDLLLRVRNIIENRERIRRRFTMQTDFVVEEQHYSDPDENFVRKAVDCVRAHLADPDYDRDSFASDMCVSSSTLYNKLRALTGQNITGFISSIRLKEACRIAKAHPKITIGELSVKVGFNSPKYFSKCFKKEFGMLLKDYVAQEE